MKTVIEPRPATVHTQVGRVVGSAFVVGGIAFFFGGLLHPSDSGHGNKVQQLHDMLVDSSWYPSHAMLLAATVLFGAAIFVLRRRHDLGPEVERFLGFVLVIACVATVSMTIHLLAALGASSVAGGKPSLLSRAQAVNEAIDAGWGLGLAALAVVGGLTRIAGNRLTIPLGLVGGVAFAVASATIPYTDAFDSVFKVGSLVSVWAVVVGVMAFRRPG